MDEVKVFCDSRRNYRDFVVMTKDTQDLFKEVAIEILDDNDKSEWAVVECENIIKYSSIRVSRYIFGESTMFSFPISSLIHPALHIRSLSDLYSDIYTTEHSLYEFPHPYQISQQLNFLTKELRNRPRLTLDLFCGSGIDLLGLATVSDNIIGVDIEKHSVALARINARRFAEISNITVLCDDALEVINKIDGTPDLIYLDPPWYGPSYKLKSDIDLVIDGKELSDLCRDMITKYPHARLFLKLPRNYKFSNLNFLPLKYQTVFKKDGIEVSYFIGITP
jgi:predicted RNA methylase